jgi:hypothetical protein
METAWAKEAFQELTTVSSNAFIFLKAAAYTAFLFDTVYSRNNISN